MNLAFLPSLPFTLSYPLLFGVLLVAGMLGGEIARIARMPRIIGYVVVGFLLAPLTRAMGLGSLLDEARIFVDLALGLVLFDLGRRMDLQWMKRDWTLAAAGFAESLLAFVAVFATLLALRLRAGEIGGTRGRDRHDHARPPCCCCSSTTRSRKARSTERAMNLVALNGLFGLHPHHDPAGLGALRGEERAWRSRSCTRCISSSARSRWARRWRGSRASSPAASRRRARSISR